MNKISQEEEGGEGKNCTVSATDQDHAGHCTRHFFLRREKRGNLVQSVRGQKWTTHISYQSAGRGKNTRERKESERERERERERESK